MPFASQSKSRMYLIYIFFVNFEICIDRPMCVAIAIGVFISYAFVVCAFCALEV